MASSTIGTARCRCYAAFDTQTGEVLGKPATRHTSAEFVAFLTEIVANQPTGKEIQVIADNLSTRKTQLVEQFLTKPSCGSPKLTAT